MGEPLTRVEVLYGMKISTPPLLKMRSVVSEDGRWARFFLLFKTGQNAAFSLPFNTIGLYLKAVKNVIRTMSDRIAARGAFSNAEIADALVGSRPSRAAGMPRLALLWVETTDSVVFTFRLDHGATEMFTDALRDDEGAGSR